VGVAKALPFATPIPVQYPSFVRERGGATEAEKASIIALFSF
jgi:hypothetical protein